MLGGESVSPIDAAKRVQKTAEFDGWIHGPLQPSILCPLSDAEVRPLYRLQGIVSLADVAELSVPQPELASLVSAANFRFSHKSRLARHPLSTSSSRTLAAMRAGDFSRAFAGTASARAGRSIVALGGGGMAARGSLRGLDWRGTS